MRQRVRAFAFGPRHLAGSPSCVDSTVRIHGIVYMDGDVKESIVAASCDTRAEDENFEMRSARREEGQEEAKLEVLQGRLT
jgi:predicted patatin/cPLA2 family phospholipase